MGKLSSYFNGSIGQKHRGATMVKSIAWMIRTADNTSPKTCAREEQPFVQIRLFHRQVGVRGAGPLFSIKNAASPKNRSCSFFILLTCYSSTRSSFPASQKAAVMEAMITINGA